MSNRHELNGKNEARGLSGHRAAPLAFLVVLVAAMAVGCGKKEAPAGNPAAEKESAQPASVVELTPAELKSAALEIEAIASRTAISSLRFTGTVEANQQLTQQVTPLVSGRVDQVGAALGDRVRAGSVLAILSSPEVAEMHGKLIEAEARETLAASTLTRAKRLAELGATAGKDLAAAEAEAQVAKAEVRHLENSLLALGAVQESSRDHNIAAVALTSPIDGVVTERMVNPGSGVEPGKPVFTVANLSELWVIASVPESQVASLEPGDGAEVRAAALGNRALHGKVSFIDPNLNEETRTARVRVSVANPNEVLKAGMFCEVTLTPKAPAGDPQLMVPEDALQRLGERTVVFVDEGSGKFRVHDVELGDKVDGYRVVVTGLTAGDRVVKKGGFVLKSQLLEGEFGEGE
jgi:cobalt-zinc-cadmium efflux system membrane fusion protein